MCFNPVAEVPPERPIFRLRHYATRSHAEYFQKHDLYLSFAKAVGSKGLRQYRFDAMNYTFHGLNWAPPTGQPITHNQCYRDVGEKDDPLQGCKPLIAWPGACGEPVNGTSMSQGARGHGA